MHSGNEIKKVLVAMSGGVDSSASVRLLLDKGYECAGAMMRLYSNGDIGLDEDKTCCSLKDAEDARLAAYKLGIEFYMFNLSADFKEKVIDHFVNTYISGGTPNPCIECNRYLKFGKFLERAELLGYDHIATGHYVRREYDEKSGRWLLKRARDAAKDQSYVLYSLTQHQLECTLFPAGECSKEEIRQIALKNSLVNASKPDSQDICFIPDGDYAKFITGITGEQKRGKIVLGDGTVLGEHKGLIHYTVGQRRGIGVSYSEPLFVTGKNTAENTLILGTKDKLSCRSLIAGDLNFIPFDKPDKPFECTAQTRYHQTEAQCTVYPLDDGTAKVVFASPHSAVSKGQAVVFYNGDYVVGGGTILRKES